MENEFLFHRWSNKFHKFNNHENVVKNGKVQEWGKEEEVKKSSNWVTVEEQKKKKTSEQELCVRLVWCQRYDFLIIKITRKPDKKV